MERPGGIADGEAMGINTTIDYFAQTLSSYLQFPVVNETGMTGSYDFYLRPDDPQNHDLVSDALGVVHRLGFKLKRGRGPIEILVIDNVDPPSPN